MALGTNMNDGSPQPARPGMDAEHGDNTDSETLPMTVLLEDQNQNPKTRGSRGSLFAFLSKNAGDGRSRGS